MPIKNPKVGQRVVFAKDKYSESPGERAQQISGTPKGDGYSYIVEKYWVVDELLESGMLLLRTRRGKLHRIHAEDPGLRLPTLWERLFLGSRFPTADSQQETSAGEE